MPPRNSEVARMGACELECWCSGLLGSIEGELVVCLAQLCERVLWPNQGRAAQWSGLWFNHAGACCGSIMRERLNGAGCVSIMRERVVAQSRESDSIELVVAQSCESVLWLNHWRAAQWSGLRLNLARAFCDSIKGRRFNGAGCGSIKR